MNLLEKFEQKHIDDITSHRKEMPLFRAGDTLNVGIRVIEGKRNRVQYFRGVCIATGGKGLGKYFLIRKIVSREGIEKKIPLYSPIVDSIVVEKKGKVRRRKLYYLRNLRGKAARISERQVAR